MNTGSHELQREFGFCNILWKIKHFCLHTCRRDWLINSPEFYVRATYCTRWKITLNEEVNSVTDGGVICAFLHRLEDDTGLPRVRVNFKMTLLDGKTNQYSFSDTEHYFEQDGSIKVYLKNLNEVLSRFRPFEIDVVNLECKLIVSFDENEKMDAYIDQGIFSLSNDLINLFITNKYYDVVLKVKEKNILAHKAILSVRNVTFATIFESKSVCSFMDLLPSNSGCSDTNLSNQLYPNVDEIVNIIAYLYSGNLKEVIDKPSVSIFEWATILDVTEVIQYYAPDELTLLSSIDTEEIVFFWVINNFDSIDKGHILSPLTENTFSTIWQFRLFPNSHHGHVSISADLVHGKLPLTVSYEAAIMNANNEYFNYKRTRKSLDSKPWLAFADFIRRDSLMNSPLLEEGTLRLAFKLRTVKGSPTSSCGYSSISLVTTISQKMTFEILSLHMRHLLETGIYSDATIHFEGYSFRVHKCVLESRSDVLSKNLSEKLKDRTEITISFSELKPEDLSFLLIYIYSGTIDSFTHDVLYELYELASKLGMRGLMTKTLQIYNRTVN